MQERKIFVFGGWDTPVCYNDMYMLDLGESHTYWFLCSRHIYMDTGLNTSCKIDIKNSFVFLRSDGVFCSENDWKSPLSSEVYN